MWHTRLASESDLPAVRALWKANPVGGKAPYYFDSPPFRKPGYRLYLIERDGRVVGTFSLCPERLAEHEAIYITDAVLDRSVRGRRLVNLACTRLLDDVLTPEVEFLTGLFEEENGNGESMMRSKHLRVLYRTSFEIHYLPALRAREPEVTEDYEQVSHLVNAFYREYAFFPRLTPEDLARREDFRVIVARRRGRITACAGIRKLERFRRTMLVRPAPLLRAARRTAALLNRRVRAVERNGTAELVVHEVTEPAFLPGRERDLFRVLDMAARDRDAHALQAAAHPTSPLAAVLRKRVGVRFRARLYVFQYGPQSAPLPEVREPVYHDFSLV